MAFIDELSDKLQSAPKWTYIVAIAFLFSLFYVVILYCKDKYEKEPPRKIAKAFYYGMLATILAVIFNTLALTNLGLTKLQLIAIGGPIIEEACKGLFVLRLRDDPEFDGAMDGLLYGGTIGAGFAFIENISYGLTAYTQFDFTAGVQLTFIRGLGLVVGHLLFTGYLGSEVGRSKIQGGTWVKGYIVAVTLHSLWNTNASYVLENAPMLAVIGIIVLVVSYFKILTRRIRWAYELDQALLYSKGSEEKPFQKYCIKCGAKVLEGSKFCIKCGTKLLER
ncbi:MAG: PrsW family glutamic-type intramembrane protease [Candidatus Hodarchaeota archaeon]